MAQKKQGFLWSHGHIPWRQMCMLLPDALSFSQGVWNSKLRKLLRCEQRVNEPARASRRVFTWATQQASDFQRHQAYFATFVFWHAQLSSSRLLITKNLETFPHNFQQHPRHQIQPGFPARLSWFGHSWTFEAQRMAFSHRCWWRNGFHGGRAGKSRRCQGGTPEMGNWIFWMDFLLESLSIGRWLRQPALMTNWRFARRRHYINLWQCLVLMCSVL